MRVLPFLIVLPIVASNEFFKLPEERAPGPDRRVKTVQAVRTAQPSVSPVITPVVKKERPAPTPNPLKAFVRKWKGTPYRWGGTSRRGVDCSGFAQRLYHDVYGEDIPRVTRQQIRMGQPVKRYRAGDLIFFTHRDGTPHHVAVHLGDGKIAHSARGRGVIVERESVLKRYRVSGRRL